MSNSNHTIVRQFWSHVYKKPDSVAVFVKNQAKGEKAVIITGGIHPGGIPTTSMIEPPKYRRVSWRQSGLIVSELMLFLKMKGVRKGDRIGILSWNSPEWIWIDMAIQSLGATTVPIYPNSASEQVNFILENSGSRLIFCDSKEQIEKVDTNSGVTACLFEEAFVKVFDYSGKTIPDGTPVNTPRELVATPDAERLASKILANLYLGGKLNDNFLGIRQEDVSILIYTSGSTGIPKGVVQLHGTIASACLSLRRHGFEFTDEDIYLSYLPLAHIYERVNGAALCMWYGVTASYCAVEEMPEVVKDIRPTILLGVPKVWRKIKEKIDHQLGQATGLKARIRDWSLKQKAPGFKRWVADLLVFRKIRAGLGGRVRLLLSGGAAIAEDILTFFELAGFSLRQGYGLTETAGAASVNTLDNNKVGSVGKVLDCVEVRIEPIEGVEGKSGIIWLKGATITPGYWNLPEDNAKSFKEGWFNTGDIGFVDDDGYLWITGRAKRLMKTDGGKYVPTEKLENAFDSIPLIEFVVPVGDARPFIGALFFLSREVAHKILNGAGEAVPAGADAAFYANHPLIQAKVAEAVTEANKEFERWETIKQYTIVPVEATVDNGLMTTKRTIKTEQVMGRYNDLVEELYTRKRPS